MPGFTCTDTLYTDRQVSRLLVFIGCGLWIGSAICASWLTTVSTAQQHAGNSTQIVSIDKVSWQTTTTSRSWRWCSQVAGICSDYSICEM